MADWQDLPSNLADIMRTYRVRPEGMSLEQWYMQQGEITPPAKEILAFSGPPSTWKTSDPIYREPELVAGGVRTGPYTTEWDLYDIKAAAAGKNGFLGPSDFWSLADWSLYAKAVAEHTKYAWDGTNYVIPGGDNGSDDGIGGLMPLLLVAAVAMFMG